MARSRTLCAATNPDGGIAKVSAESRRFSEALLGNERETRLVKGWRDSGTRADAMKATTLLERQHRSLEQLCEAVERGSVSVRESLLPQLAGDLVAHIAIEEEVFYPAACEALRERSWLSSGRRRHAQARQALDRVCGAPADGDEFAIAIKELRRVLDLHARDDEERLFPELEVALDVHRMRALGLAMLPLYHAKLEAGYAREPSEASDPSAHGDAARS